MHVRLVWRMAVNQDAVDTCDLAAPLRVWSMWAEARLWNVLIFGGVRHTAQSSNVVALLFALLFALQE